MISRFSWHLEINYYIFCVKITISSSVSSVLIILSYWTCKNFTYMCCLWIFFLHQNPSDSDQAKMNPMAATLYLKQRIWTYPYWIWLLLPVPQRIFQWPRSLVKVVLDLCTRWSYNLILIFFLSHKKGTCIQF